MTGPAAGLRGWRHLAACLDLPTDEWFPGPGEDSAVARKVCRGCPVRVECLNDAMATEPTPWETRGIRGGLTARDRNKLRRQPAAQDRAVA